MIQKIKAFLQRNSLLFIAILFGIVVILFFTIFGILFPKKSLRVIEDKVTDVIDKINEKIIDIDIKKENLEIDKKIKEQIVQDKKQNLEKNLELINNISDKKKRVKSLIEFNKSIKVLK